MYIRPGCFTLRSLYKGDNRYKTSYNDDIAIITNCAVLIRKNCIVSSMSRRVLEILATFIQLSINQ